MKRLIIAEDDHFSPVALERLRKHFNLSCGFVPTNQTVGQGEILWLRFKPFSLDRLPDLECVVCNATDVSHLPLDECQRRGIEVLSLKGIEGLDTVHATAEHTISLMLQALRHRCDRTSKRIGRELHGSNVLVIGFGRIGTQVWELCDSFGADATSGNANDLDLLKRADIVSIHCDLNDTSRGMVNAEFIAKLKPGCILVNTARHAIVDGDEILYWLHRDKNAIYAHDFSDEWSPFDSEQFGFGERHERIIGTPHIGGWTIESLHKTEELLAEKVIEWSKSKLEVTCQSVK